MSRIKSLIITGVVLAASLATGSMVRAQANNTVLCTRPALPLSEYGGKNFTVKGNKITAKVKLTGAANCRYDLTLATFSGYKKIDTPENKFFKFDIPRDSQKLYNTVSKSVTGPGVYTLEATIPQCIYQADVITGKPIKSTVGQSYYSFVNADNFTNSNMIVGGTDRAHIHDATFGGEKVCEEPKQPEPPKVEVCPIDPTMKKDDPNCKVCPYDPSMAINDKDCKEKPKPEVPATPVTPSTPTTTAPVASIPNTGIGSVIGTTLGLGSLTGATYSYLQGKRDLLKSKRQ